MKYIITGLFLFLFLLTPTLSFAKLLPQAKTAGKQPVIKPSGNTVLVSARLRRDRHALTIFFNNIKAATNTSYTLIYQTQGKQEGAGGAIREGEGNTATRELLFGTCSKNDCTYHTGITNMKLEVTGQLKNGKTFTKRFKIKV